MESRSNKYLLAKFHVFFSRAEECKEKMKALEIACNDTLLPIDIEVVKSFLKKIHELRKVMLETLMGSLKDGKILLDKLRDIANEGTLDSRPDRIKSDAMNGKHGNIVFSTQKNAFLGFILYF